MTEERIRFTLDMAREATADRTPGPFGFVVRGSEADPSSATVAVGDDLAMVGDTIVRHPDGTYTVETEL